MSGVCFGMCKGHEMIATKLCCLLCHFILTQRLVYDGKVFSLILARNASGLLDRAGHMFDFGQ